MLPVEVEAPSPFDSAVAGVVIVEALAFGALVALGDAGLTRMLAWDTLAEPGLVGN